MITIHETDIARECIKVALAKGADSARISLNKCVSDSVTMLNGEIDKVTHSADRSIYRASHLPSKSRLSHALGTICFAGSAQKSL